jgi:FMNH2-dependent dimethyl sulfone monooxygenase
VGAGWYDREYKAFGFPMDHRVDRFEEALQIIVPLIRGETVSFVGRYYQTAEASLLPPPSPSIPLLIASKGPRMLRLTARYADAWNTAWFGAPNDELRQRVRRMDAALEAEERESSSLRRTVGITVRDPDQMTGGSDDSTFAGTVDELARVIDEHEHIGFDDIVVSLEPLTERSIDRLADAMRVRAG